MVDLNPTFCCEISQQPNSPAVTITLEYFNGAAPQRLVMQSADLADLAWCITNLPPAPAGTSD
jgi:hypothetical protein